MKSSKRRKTEKNKRKKIEIFEKNDVISSAENTLNEIKRLQSLLPYADHGAYSQLQERLRDLRAQIPDDTPAREPEKKVKMKIVQTGSKCFGYWKFGPDSFYSFCRFTLISISPKRIEATNLETGWIEEVDIPIEYFLRE